jgi:UDP-glucose:(heptosyl)LPS alpha-1,3-glucosyltransferase
VSIKPGGFTNYGRARSFHTRLCKILQEKRFDAIVGFNKMPDLDIYFAADSCFVSRAADRHSSLYRVSPRYRCYSRFENAVFSPQSPTHILSISQRENEVFRRYYLTPDSRFTLLPPGLDDTLASQPGELPLRAQVREDLGISEDTFLVLLVGSGFGTKGLDRAIKALASLPEGLREQTQLLVAGDGRQEPYKRLAARYGVSGRVRFLGAREDVPALLGAGDLLLHPAYAELAGAVILESIRAGLPVLVSHTCGYAWHVDHAAAGRVLSAAFSQRELNRVLAEMLVSPERPRWSENGRAYAAGLEFHSQASRAVDAIERISIGGTEKPGLFADDEGRPYVNEFLDEELRGRTGFDDLVGIEGEVYREGPGRRTLRFSTRNRAWFLKLHTGVGWREIFKNLLYFKQPVIGAANEWHGMHRLRQLGIDTLTPAAYGWRGRNPAQLESFIISEALPPSISLEDYSANWGQEARARAEQLRMKRWLISRLGEIARILHQTGANHRDFYLCHFLLSLNERDGRAILEDCRIYLIDLHRMQLRRRTPTRWAVKDVAGLYFSSMDVGLTSRDCYRFMKAYSGGQPLREVLKGELLFWHRVRVRAERMYRQGQNKPADQRSRAPRGEV